MSADLRCFGCGEAATRIATLKANPGTTRLTCEAGVATFDADLWTVRKLNRRDFGLEPLPRGRGAAVTA